MEDDPRRKRPFCNAFTGNYIKITQNYNNSCWPNEGLQQSSPVGLGSGGSPARTLGSWLNFTKPTRYTSLAIIPGPLCLEGEENFPNHPIQGQVPKGWVGKIHRKRFEKLGLEPRFFC